MFVFIKKKAIVIAVTIILSVTIVVGAVLTVSVVAAKFTPNLNVTVVIDAGHGGVDGGVVGISGAVEAPLNLSVANKLAAEFASCGVNVIMTRKTNNGLYGLSTKNFKSKDMQARADIINSAKPALVISIHMNSFPSSSEKGAQVFFKKSDENGRSFADCIQGNFKSYLNSRRESKVGDYFILNCTNYTSVIVECGFLTNAEEEALLKTEKYQEKIAYNIFMGSMQFLNLEPYTSRN